MRKQPLDVNEYYHIYNRGVEKRKVFLSNRDYFIHGYCDDFDWPYSSFLDYTGKGNGGICDTGVILNEFKNKNEYREFIKENSLYMKEKKEREKYLLE